MRVLPTQPSHVIAILAEGLRPEDLREVTVRGDSPESVVWRSVAASQPHCFTILCDGAAVGLFGVALNLLPEAPDVGFVWMLSTPSIRGAKRALVTDAPLWVEYMARLATLTNFIDTRNTGAMRLIQRLGFTLHDEIVEPSPGVKFRRFSCVTPP